MSFLAVIVVSPVIVDLPILSCHLTMCRLVGMITEYFMFCHNIDRREIKQVGNKQLEP
jgi:hypothetical protein